MKRMAIAGLVVAAGLSGCASWKTSTKNVNLEDNSVALDAKQRVVVSKTVKKYVSDAGDVALVDSDKPAVAPTGGKVGVPATGTATSSDASGAKGEGRLTFDGPFTCAEPSPDALSVLGASANLGLSKPGGVSGSGALSLSEAAASIGLRTQSIQLLRDQNFRICEAGSNNQITDLEAQNLLRRNQSTMLGVLAIEQLTGPVVAAQAALTSAANAGAGAPSTEDLATAKEAVKTAENELTAALKTVDDKVVDQKEKHAAAAKAQKNLDDAEAGSDTTKLEEALTAAQGAAARADNDVVDARRKVDVAERRVSEARQDLAVLNTGRASAGSVSSAQLTQMRIQSVMNGQQLARAVGYIVSETNASYVRDGCFGLVADMISNPKKIKALNDIKTTANSKGEIAPVEVVKTALRLCAAQFNQDVVSTYLEGKKVEHLGDKDLKEGLDIFQ